MSLNCSNCETVLCIFCHILPHRAEVSFGLVGLILLIFGMAFGLALWRSAHPPSKLATHWLFILGGLVWLAAGVAYWILLDQPIPQTDFGAKLERAFMYICFGYFFGYFGFILAGLLVLFPKKLLALLCRLY